MNNAKEPVRPPEEEGFLALVGDLVSPILIEAGFEQVSGPSVGWATPHSPLGASNVRSPKLFGRLTRRSGLVAVASVLYEADPGSFAFRFPHLRKAVEGGMPVEAWVTLEGGSGYLDAGIGGFTVRELATTRGEIGAFANTKLSIEERVEDLAGAVRLLLWPSGD